MPRQISQIGALVMMSILLGCSSVTGEDAAIAAPPPIQTVASDSQEAIHTKTATYLDHFRALGPKFPLNSLSVTDIEGVVQADGEYFLSIRNDADACVVAHIPLISASTLRESDIIDVEIDYEKPIHTCSGNPCSRCDMYYTEGQFSHCGCRFAGECNHSVTEGPCGGGLCEEENN